MTSWYSAWGLATLCAASLGAPAWASSLAPISAQALAGEWVLYPEGEAGQACVLQLQAGGRVDSGSASCAVAWLGQPVAGWASKPDGLALSADNRRTLVVLNPAGSGRYRGSTRQGLVLSLERREP